MDSDNSTEVSLIILVQWYKTKALIVTLHVVAVPKKLLHDDVEVDLVKRTWSGGGLVVVRMRREHSYYYLWGLLLRK